ncbi:uncharacterized protein [Cardiocondyla obscurior]|uniref:uncharacterized protein n=1 Tax=Cardiocondyla obscurior TaxID=286306 RepID=UPI00396588F3
MLDRSEGQVVAGKGERPRSYCSLQLVTRRLLLATRCPLACPVLVVSHRLPESRDPHVATCSQSQNVTGRRRRKQHPRRTERRRRSRKGIGLQRGNVDYRQSYMAVKLRCRASDRSTQHLRGGAGPGGIRHRRSNF